jgi:hypothetical protein
MSPQTSFFRRFWKPAAVTGAGGTAMAIWLEEIMLFAQEILALIFLPILAGVIYLLDIFMFKSRLPKRETLDNSTKQGEQR